MKNFKIVSGVSVVMLSLCLFGANSAAAAVKVKPATRHPQNHTMGMRSSSLKISDMRLRDDFHTTASVTAVNGDAVTLEYKGRDLTTGISFSTSTKAQKASTHSLNVSLTDFKAKLSKMQTKTQEKNKKLNNVPVRNDNTTYAVGDKVSVNMVSVDGGKTYTLQSIHKVHAPSKIDLKKAQTKPQGKLGTSK